MNNRCTYEGGPCWHEDGCAGCKYYQGPAKEYEWVDCTKEVVEAKLVDSFDYPGYYCMNTIHKKNAIRVVVAPGPDDHELRFRIERRVEKPRKPAFKVGDKVLYDGKEWEIDSFDNCFPPCVKLRRCENIYQTVGSASYLEAIK